MRLQQLDTELKNRGLKLTFREKQSLLSQSGPISEVLERHLNPPRPHQLPELQNGGPITENYISAPASTTSVRLPPMLTSSQLQRTPINNRPQREIDETRYAPIPYSRDTTAVESTYADMGALMPAHYVDKVLGINRTERLRDSMVNTAIENLDLSKKYYKKYTPENIEAVKALQRELVSKGLDIGPKGVDGKFGDNTLNAYRKSQNVKDLSSEQKRDECRNSDGSYKEGCAEYVSEVTRNQILGSAWEMAENIESNGGVLKYNIYDDPRFKNVKTVKDLKRVTREVKATSKAKSENFEVGDAVGIYWKDSEYHQKAMDEGKRGTKNTHVGIVTSIKDGVPIISHNIHGKLYHEPYNHLTIGWVGSASQVPELSTKNDRSGDVEKIIDGTVEDMPELFNVNIDKETLRRDIRGILKVESGGGKAIPTETDIKKSTLFRTVLGEGGIENVSTGIAKIKSNTLSVREKALLGFDSKGETFADDIKATTYLYLKHYMEAKQYADANPDLNLTENDLRSMAILGHNQGMDKLLSIGANSFRSKEDEIQMLREISEKGSSTKDISSTDLRYFKKLGLRTLGDLLYDMRYPGGHATYVGRVKSHGDQLSKYQTGGLYNTDRAKELGYEPDETGHMPSVDNQTGAWLKSKKHPTAWMEYLHATLNQRTAQNETVVVDPDGHFGENQLQYVPRNKYQRGGQYDPTPASSTRVAMPPPLQPSDFYGDSAFTPLQPWAGAQFRTPSAPKSINQGELHKSPSIREKIGAALNDLGTDFAYAPRTVMTMSPPTIEEYRANRSGRMGDSEGNTTMNRVESVAEGLTSAMEMLIGDKWVRTAINKVAGPVGKANLYRDFQPGIVSKTDDAVSAEVSKGVNVAKKLPQSIKNYATKNYQLSDDVIQKNINWINKETDFPTTDEDLVTLYRAQAKNFDNLSPSEAMLAKHNNRRNLLFDHQKDKLLSKIRLKNKMNYDYLIDEKKERLNNPDFSFEKYYGNWWSDDLDYVKRYSDEGYGHLRKDTPSEILSIQVPRSEADLRKVKNLISHDSDLKFTSQSHNNEFILPPNWKEQSKPLYADAENVVGKAVGAGISKGVNAVKNLKSAVKPAASFVDNAGKSYNSVGNINATVNSGYLPNYTLFERVKMPFLSNDTKNRLIEDKVKKDAIDFTERALGSEEFAKRYANMKSMTSNVSEDLAGIKNEIKDKLNKGVNLSNSPKNIETLSSESLDKIIEDRMLDLYIYENHHISVPDRLKKILPAYENRLNPVPQRTSVKELINAADITYSPEKIKKGSYTPGNKQRSDMTHSEHVTATAGTPGDLLDVIVHEAMGHGKVTAGTSLTQKEREFARSIFKPNHSNTAFDRYIRSEDEVIARVDEIRTALNFNNPYATVTIKDLEKYNKMINQSTNIPGFDPIKGSSTKQFMDSVDKNKLVNFMNNFYTAIPAAIGTGATLQSQAQEIPNYQTGGPVPTKADSLFLLNNNKIIQKLLDSGYQWSDNVPISKPPFDSKKDAIEAVKKIYARDTDKTQSISRKGELKDYISIKGEMVGSSDWRPGGGEDKSVPMQYVHPSIAPQFKGDLIPPRVQDPVVFSYGYENIAITPWSMLTPAQKADRRMLYGDSGTPFEKSVISATTSSTPVPVKTPTLNKQSYTGIDPISRYRLPERQIEEAQIQSGPAVTSGNIQGTVQGYSTREGNFRYNRSTKEWKQVPYGYINRGDNRGRIEP